MFIAEGAFESYTRGGSSLQESLGVFEQGEEIAVGLSSFHKFNFWSLSRLRIEAARGWGVAYKTSTQRLVIYAMANFPRRFASQVRFQSARPCGRGSCG